jgi:hypothetical protein
MMLILNLLLWAFFSCIVYMIRKGSPIGVNDLLLDNSVIPSHYDFAFSVMVGGWIAIWVWTRISMLFLNFWEVLRMTPAQLWAFKNLSIWAYGFGGMLLFPQLLVLIALPIAFVIEKTDIHFGDLIMPYLVDISRYLLLSLVQS